MVRMNFLSLVDRRHVDTRHHGAIAIKNEIKALSTHEVTFIAYARIKACGDHDASDQHDALRNEAQ
jgi:hypothetical protein